MEKYKIKSFNRQLVWMYTLGILHIVLCVIGLTLSHFHLKSAFLFWPILVFNVLAMIFFKPWRIVGYINMGYGYKKSLEALSTTK